jgi:hypothetical protein
MGLYFLMNGDRLSQVTEVTGMVNLTAAWSHIYINNYLPTKAVPPIVVSPLPPDELAEVSGGHFVDSSFVLGSCVIFHGSK